MKYYRRGSVVIPPPVDSSFFTPDSSQDSSYYLYVSRLVRYKRGDLAVEAFNRLGKPLIIVGDGPEKKRLEKAAKPNIQFAGRQSDEALLKLYRGCRALIFPQEEDFGIVPLEAQACGKPVIAYGVGGALDTVQPGVTGLFFPRQTAESLMSAVVEFQASEFDADAIRQHACAFDIDRFKRAFSRFVEQKVESHGAGMMLAGHPTSINDKEQFDGAVDRLDGT